MPVAASLSGTLARTAVGSGAAWGTLASIGTGSGSLSGTLAVDRTLFLAFYGRVRLTRPDVLVDGELMANLVDTVEIDTTLADPVAYATFSLSDKRSACRDPDSVSDGARPVEIDFWAGPPGGVLKWQAFLGITETSQNTMPYRPRGVFKSVSLASLWAASQGCLNIPAFSNLTRGQIVAAFAATAGVSISNADQIGGGIVVKPIDLTGMTPYDLIMKYGELEGWFVRSTADGSGLEIIDEDRMLDGAPLYCFDESNYFDVPETLPDRPTTDWILSSTQMVMPPDAADGGGTVETITETRGVDGSGNPTLTRIISTTQANVEIKNVTEQWATAVRPGFDLWPAEFQMVSRVTVESTWEEFHYIDASGVARTMLSTQLSKKTTKIETLSGIPATVASGIPWIQGGYWVESYATLMLTQETDETYTWKNCAPDTTRVTTSAYYAPLGDPADTGNVHLFGDGTYRYTSTDWFYRWRIISDAFTQWNGPTSGQTTLSQYFKVGKAAPPNEGLDIEKFLVVSVSPTTPSQPTSGSTTQPQFTQQVIMTEFDATEASGYRKLTQSETIDFAESIDELNKIALRRIRRVLADQLDISHPAIPFLREGDHVQVTNRARSLVAVDCYVYAIKRTAAVLNGAMRQVTTVKIPMPGI